LSSGNYRSIDADFTGIEQLRTTALSPMQIAINQGPREGAFDSRKGILG